MRSKILLMLIAALFSQYAAAGAHEEKSEASEALAKSQSCIECHENLEVVLANQGVDTITAKSDAIRAGDTSHPPGGPQNLSDDVIAEIAKILDRGAL